MHTPYTYTCTYSKHQKTLYTMDKILTNITLITREGVQKNLKIFRNNL